MGLYKRKQVWWMRFNYKGKQLRRSTETTNQKLADKIYYKVLTQIAEDKWFDRSVVEDKTLRDLLEKYFKEYVIPNSTPKTVAWKEDMTNNALELFGDMQLSDITPRHIASYKTVCRDKGLSPATINHKLGVLGHAFNIATREWEWLAENPVARVGREKVNNARDRWLTLEEEQRLIDACVLYMRGNVKLPRYWLQEIVVFALNTGLKANAKLRDIRSNYVFLSEAGTEIEPRNLLRGFYTALKRAEIEDFRFHDLRHTFATRLAHHGVDLYKVARLLGHKDIRMTQRYSHHYSESLRDGVEYRGVRY